MFLLYNGNGSGSKEARLVKRVPEVQWGLVRRNAIRVLRIDTYDSDAADVLENLPFQLWEATNGFGDQFDLLYMKVSVSKYLEIEVEADTYRSRARYEKIAETMEQVGNRIRFVAMDAETDDPAVISTPQLQTKSLAVSRALTDFEVLISSKGGPISALDRIHTALHGYLQTVCDEANVVYTDDADITALFGLIRESHPKLQTYPPGVDGTNILRGLARIVDAFNRVRNRHSMAHPSDELLEEPEALLAVNAVKTLLHYLDKKLR